MLIKCLFVESGAYLRWALVQGEALVKFSPFSTNSKYMTCNVIKHEDLVFWEVFWGEGGWGGVEGRWSLNDFFYL